MFTPGAVIDTNIFVGGGFNEGSHSRRILDAVRADELLLIWNEATRSETLAVVGKIPPLSEDDAEALFGEAGRFDHPTDPDRLSQIDDPTDRKFAALAAAAGVPVVTNDSDLLGPRQHVPIAVYTPTEFVDMLGIFDD